MIDTHGKWLRLNSLMMLTTDNAIFWLPAGECIYGRMYAFIQRYTHGSRTTCPCGAHSGSPRLHFYARLTQIIVFQEIISSFPSPPFLPKGTRVQEWSSLPEPGAGLNPGRGQKDWAGITRHSSAPGMLRTRRKSGCAEQAATVWTAARDVGPYLAAITFLISQHLPQYLLLVSVLYKLWSVTISMCIFQ